jgi:hypothetical protein
MVAAANTPDSSATAAGPAGPGPIGAKPAKRKSCAKLKRRLKRSKSGNRAKLKRKLRRCRARR